MALTLKQLRLKKRNAVNKYTAQEAAERLGVSVPYYRKLEEHPELLTVKQLHKLAKYLDCNVDDFFISK